MSLPAGFKPLLAAPLKDVADLRYPVLASPKIDGMRCIITPDGVALSRKLKPIPSGHVQAFAQALMLFGGPILDGEIVCEDFAATQSNCMRQSHDPFRFTYHVFDIVMPEVDYRLRYRTFSGGNSPIGYWPDFFPERSRDIGCGAVLSVLQHRVVESADQLMEIHSENLAAGWEGTMTRCPMGRYKFGRSTPKEQILMKLKNFDDAEALVVDFVEGCTNTNEQERDALGHAKRSSAQEGRVPNGTLGAFVCEWPHGSPHYGKPQFEVGSGTNDAQKLEFWQNRERYRGQAITVKFQGFGSQDRPRFPVFKGFRPEVHL